MSPFFVTRAPNGRLRVTVVATGRSVEVAGPMVPTPRVIAPARAIIGPARRTVEWARARR